MSIKFSASLVALCAALAPAHAHAGDKPLYAPAPAWVVPAPPIDPAKLNGDSPVVLVLDNQQRLEGGTVATYLETATRAASAEVLGQLGTIAIPWMPDKGDLKIHSAEILRGGETIDLLKGGDKFAVLRREQQLEQRMLSGMLTATMSAEGLRVGDVLRMRFTITQADAALKGRAQAMAPVLADPFRAGFARARLSWPTGSAVKVRGYFEGLTLTPRASGGFDTIEQMMPLAKQPDLPGNLPGRFQRPPLIEATSFTGWSDVSKVMAPLYATDAAIAPGSALAGEVAKIAAADADPLKRAAAALQLVQDQVRYLLMGMNGGNYVPQSPARTWELRYGDCKAKTLLLLAMLRELGIESEAVLVSAEAGDLVERRLPMPAAFDHVIVRATIGGRSYWLDGTGLGTRLADIGDTPPFRHVLPLRAAGAELMPLPTHANARPDVTVTTRYDQSAGLDFPSVFTLDMRIRGRTAAMLNIAASQASTKQKRDMIQGFAGASVGEAQIAESNLAFDPATGIATVTASGVVTTPWRREDKRMRWSVDHVVDAIDLDADRSRPAWRDIPVATGGPETTEFRTTVTLPGGGAGYALEGDQTLGTTLAGVAVARKAALAGGVVTVEERGDQTGAEIPAAARAGERQKVALAKSRTLRIVAPATTPARWEQVRDGRKTGRFAPIEAVFTKAITADPDEASGYESRASFRRGIYDRKGAIADVTKLIALGGKAQYHLERAGLYSTLGETAKALADARQALALDPASDGALTTVAALEAESGNVKGGLAMLQERIDVGGKDRFAFINAKASLQSENGDAAGGIATLDAAIAERPGDPMLLNARCWIKGTAKLALDTALKDCTKAIELADNPAAALDSRAMVYYRMGRTDDALADLDAALDASPGMSSSLFLRGVVRKQAGDAAGSAHDLEGARLITPLIDKDYAKFGIVP